MVHGERGQGAPVVREGVAPHSVFAELGRREVSEGFGVGGSEWNGRRGRRRGGKQRSKTYPHPIPMPYSNIMRMKIRLPSPKPQKQLKMHRPRIKPFLLPRKTMQFKQDIRCWRNNRLLKVHFVRWVVDSPPCDGFSVCGEESQCAVEFRGVAGGIEHSEAFEDGEADGVMAYSAFGVEIFDCGHESLDGWDGGYGGGEGEV